MKNLLKRILNRLGLYEYLKYSRPFSFYEALSKPAVKKAFHQEVRFYRSFLPPCSLVFDIGANDGHKTEAFLTFADRVVCCEPDRKNQQTLAIRFRNRKQRVAIEKTAIGSLTGTNEMYIHHAGSAFNTLNPRFREITEADKGDRWNETIKFESSVQVPVTTLDNLIEKYGPPCFIKVDVEGYEIEVIKGLTQAIPYISLECLFPEFREELYFMIDHLTDLADCRFNIAVHEALLWDEFVDRAVFLEFLQDFKGPHFEMVVEMRREN